MIKITFLLFSFSLFLLARENPFFPIDSESDLPLTTNQFTKEPQLKRATMKLPSTARVIETVTVKYKNLNGSISQKSIELGNSIDWHLPLFISQNYEINEKPREKKIKKVASLKFISFYVGENKMKILTKDKLIRNFLLVKPHRIVCDFKRDTDIGSYTKKISQVEGFTKINVGTHKGYYRVVIELDGSYRYEIDKSKEAYIISLI
ncbi:AMIN domain-containing protein [Sulfurimonas sp.]|uniref:AMIN domain-containing protein n=1 Tax=Sulfurimonas sp. TaxID=2022749 RepID=UPI0026191795|nr:AMIN domain-containing protein [Sulfurimonas sp.]